MGCRGPDSISLTRPAGSGYAKVLVKPLSIILGSGLPRTPILFLQRGPTVLLYVSSSAVLPSLSLLCRALVFHAGFSLCHRGRGLSGGTHLKLAFLPPWLDTPRFGQIAPRVSTLGPSWPRSLWHCGPLVVPPASLCPVPPAGTPVSRPGRSASLDEFIHH